MLQVYNSMKSLGEMLMGGRVFGCGGTIGEGTIEVAIVIVGKKDNLQRLKARVSEQTQSL